MALERRLELRRKVVGAGALVLALGLFAVGIAAKHEVVLLNGEELAKEFDLPPFHQEITDRELVIDTTFTGVVREGSALHFTYDRSKPAGKRACPT